MIQFSKYKYWTLLIFICLLASSCRKQQAETYTVTDHKEIPDQEVWNSTLISTTNGQMSAKIKYGYMQRFNAQKIALFSDTVAVDFYDTQGKHTSKLIADSGRFDENNNNVEAIGNVEVVSDSGITLHTDKLWWDSGIEKVVTDQFVTITTAEQDTFYGVGFESDQSLNNWTMKEFRGKTSKQVNLNLKNGKSKKSSSSHKGDGK